jgi:hypothetical protein
MSDAAPAVTVGGGRPGPNGLTRPTASDPRWWRGPHSRPVLVVVVCAALLSVLVVSGAPSHKQTFPMGPSAIGPHVEAGTTTSIASTTTTVGPTEVGLPPPPDASPVALGGGTLAPVIYKIPTSQPVVFLTIDDGFVRDPQVVDYLRSMHLPVTVFLLTAAGRQAPGYFRSLQAAGATIQDHTLTHPRLTNLPLAAQKKELCGAASDDARTYGTRPTLMRPPYGLENRITQVAAAACGLKAVVEWTAVAANGQLTVIGGRLQPGYIIILHFTPSLLGDLRMAVAAIQAAGLSVGRLESYVT